MIGVFDSGIGGLTVVKELRRRFPGRGVVYFGDTARAPYGTKGAEAVRRFSVENARFLESKGAKAIIVACNTASAVAMDEVRSSVSVPVFGVVEPAVVKAAEVTKGRIGVIGTRGTIASEIYLKMLSEIDPGLSVWGQACPLLVPLAEEGETSGPKAEAIADNYLSQLRLRSVDTLILGCTHFPFFLSIIKKGLPDARLIDPAKETAEAFARYLEEAPALSGHLPDVPSVFYVSDKTEHFEKLASEWLNEEIRLEVARPEPLT